MIARIKVRLRLPVATLLNLLTRLSGRKVGVAIVYHRVGDPHQPRDGHLDPAMGTALFKGQLDHLRRRYRVVPARGLLAAVRSRRRGQRLPAVLTFDDDLSSHVRTVMPILRRLDLTATFFLTGASLDRPFSFWWHRLQQGLDTGALSEADVAALVLGSEDPSTAPISIHDAAKAIEALPPTERERLAEVLGERVGDEPVDSGLRASDVRALASAGFEIGFHTLRHHALPGLDDELLSRAFDEGRAELAASAVTEVTSIAYPHGKADARVAATAREAGFELGFSGRPEPARRHADPMMIGRLDPSYESVAQFALQTARMARRTDR